jgi:hypothetical protein
MRSSTHQPVLERISVVPVVCVGLSGSGGHGGLEASGVGMKGDCMSRRALGLYLSTWRCSVLAEGGMRGASMVHASMGPP